MLYSVHEDARIFQPEQDPIVPHSQAILVFARGEFPDVTGESSKDGRYVYAISIGWPGETFTTHSVRAVKGSQVLMLGVDQPLDWRQDGITLSVTIPPSIADHKPCQQAYAFKILAEPV